MKWKGIFSKGVTDLGNCDLVKHEIKFSDEKPFKEPHRRIPPALFEEVREHLKEMMEAGTIRQSSNSYSSNAVIVRKMGPFASVWILENSTTEQLRTHMPSHG